MLTLARYRLQSVGVASLPWREAWQRALYAADHGFYVTRGGPSAHFTTATHGPGGAVLADALLRLHGGTPSLVVDVGAGRGELASHLRHALGTPPPPGSASWDSRYSVAPGRDVLPRPGLASGGREVRVVAVDVVERPEGLEAGVEWLRSPGGAELPKALADLLAASDDVLVVAHEWLDVVPCSVAQVDDEGVLREVLVDPATGEESLGDPVQGADLEWAQRHWATATPGHRVEVGRSRDEAWLRLLGMVRSGTVVAVDYGHRATERPDAGTLAAYTAGRLRRPVPDGTCDVTAHVAVDTLAADEVVTQREVLRRLGVTGALPAQQTASHDPAGYLAALERASHEADLVDPGGFGGFWWVIRRIGSPDVG